MSDPPDEESLGYAEALAELDTILRRLDDDEVDVDLLGTQVERAATLIRLCRARISAARVQVERIVAELDDEAGADGSDGPDGGLFAGHDEDG